MGLNCLNVWSKNSLFDLLDLKNNLLRAWRVDQEAFDSLPALERINIPLLGCLSEAVDESAEE